MSDLNNCIFEGNLTRDPKCSTVNTAKGEISQARFTVAVNAGGKNSKASFVPCVTWGELADRIAQYFTKGKPIRVFASYITNNYEKDGQTVYSHDFRVDRFDFVNRGQRPGDVPPPAENDSDADTDAEPETEQEPEPTPKAAPKKTTAPAPAQPPAKAAPKKAAPKKATPPPAEEEDEDEIPF